MECAVAMNRLHSALAEAQSNGWPITVRLGGENGAKIVRLSGVGTSAKFAWNDIDEVIGIELSLHEFPG